MVCISSQAERRGPDTTASWLRSFLVRGRVAESEEDWLEIRIQDDTVYMAGGAAGRHKGGTGPKIQDAFPRNSLLMRTAHRSKIIILH